MANTPEIVWSPGVLDSFGAPCQALPSEAGTQWTRLGEWVGCVGPTATGSGEWDYQLVRVPAGRRSAGRPTGIHGEGDGYAHGLVDSKARAIQVVEDELRRRSREAPPTHDLFGRELRVGDRVVWFPATGPSNRKQQSHRLNTGIIKSIMPVDVAIVYDHPSASVAVYIDDPFTRQPTKRTCNLVASHGRFLIINELDAIRPK